MFAEPATQSVGYSVYITGSGIIRTFHVEYTTCMEGEIGGDHAVIKSLCSCCICRHRSLCPRETLHSLCSISPMCILIH